jgi:hypothetical protein
MRVEVVHVGEVAPPARRCQRPIIVADNGSLRTPNIKQLHQQNINTPNCCQNTHVEPTTRRLGGCCWFAIPACHRKEHTVRCRLHAALHMYAMLCYAPRCEAVASSANTHAQPSSSAPSSASVRAHPPFTSPHFTTCLQCYRPLLRQPPTPRCSSLDSFWVRGLSELDTQHI